MRVLKAIGRLGSGYIGLLRGPTGWGVGRLMAIGHSGRVLGVLLRVVLGVVLSIVLTCRREYVGRGGGRVRCDVKH